MPVRLTEARAGPRLGEAQRVWSTPLLTDYGFIHLPFWGPRSPLTNANEVI
jgi:hypothetical protein